MKVGFDWMVEKAQYSEYLRRLDARALLDYYGAERCTEQSGGDGTTEIVHSCLLDRVEPHHSHGDAHPSACFNLDKKLYVCYALGLGCDALHLIMKMEGKEALIDALPIAGKFLAGAIRDTDTMRAEIERIFAAHGGYQINLPHYDLRVLDNWMRPHPYWADRGITADAQRLLRLGYDPFAHRIVFPHLVDTHLVGWQKRVVPGETVPDYPKYLNSSGFPKSETLYGLDLAQDSPLVVVVESPMSVARAYSAGLEVPVVATFGAKVSQPQIDQLARFEAVWVWFDRDAAGLTGERKLVEGLSERSKVLVVTPDGGKDMGDATRAQMEDKLGDATPAALRLAQYDIWRRTHGRGSTASSVS